MQILDLLGSRNGTDKSSIINGTPHIVRGSPHRYLPFYESFLAPLRDQEITLLEIGVLDGGSLRMWRDYFLKGRIIGMDIVPKPHCVGDRIEIELGNQHEGADLVRVSEKYGPFDVIIDDAGHEPTAQINCYNSMINHVKPGGFYILEDIAENPSVVDYFSNLIKSVITTQVPKIESIAFSCSTTVTKVRA